MERYEVNNDTLAVIACNDRLSRIYEKGNSFYVRSNSTKIMEDSCEYYGSTLDGRLKGTKMILGSNYKLPIIVEESNDIIFFPTNGSMNEKCSWISLNHVKKYENVKGYTKVTFTDGKSITLHVSKESFEMQLLRASRLQNLLRKRTM